MPGHTEPEPELPQIDTGECGAALLGPGPGVGHQHTMVTQCHQPRPQARVAQARQSYCIEPSAPARLTHCEECHVCHDTLSLHVMHYQGSHHHTYFG